ncbi:MAG: hypothetical protein HKN13_04245 [Rhodothermales bacterium]|nr:hypothetical protein [Rhodothermales bacterium]
MKNWVLTLLLASLTVPAFAQDFSDARALIEASLEKTGGEKWSTVETMRLSTTMSIDTPQGEIFGSTKLSFRYPGYTHVKVLLDVPEEMGGSPGGMTQTSIMNPDTTYMTSDFAGTQGSAGGQGPQAATEELALLSSEDAELSLDTGDLDGKDVYIVTSVVDSTTSRIYYDKETLLRLARAVETAQGDAMVYYEDYREVEGLLVPYVQRQSMNGMAQIMKVKTVEVNPELDTKLFEVK